MKKDTDNQLPPNLVQMLEQQKKMFDNFSTLIPKITLPDSIFNCWDGYYQLKNIDNLTRYIPEIHLPEYVIPQNGFYVDIEKLFPTTAFNPSFYKAMDELSKSIMENNKALSQIASAYTSVLPTLYPSFKSFPTFTAEIIENKQISPKYGLAAHGWFISKVFPEQEEVFNIFKNKKITTEDINRYFTDFYYKNNHENLNRLLKIIVEHNGIKGRRAIINECKQIIELCEDKQLPCYTTIIPFLQAQIDTTLEALYRQYDKSKENVGFSDKAICLLVVSTLITKDPLSAHCISSFLLNNDTQDYGIERIHEVDINRHNVMHGKSITYGHKANLVRILTMFHFILDLLNISPTEEEQQLVKKEIYKKKKIYLLEKRKGK